MFFGEIWASKTIKALLRLNRSTKSRVINWRRAAEWSAENSLMTLAMLHTLVKKFHASSSNSVMQFADFPAKSLTAAELQLTIARCESSDRPLSKE
jgi:hypothetical protein